MLAQGKLSSLPLTCMMFNSVQPQNGLLKEESSRLSLFEKKLLVPGLEGVDHFRLWGFACKGSTRANVEGGTKGGEGVHEGWLVKV